MQHKSQAGVAHLWAILLVVLVLAVVGGGGYYIWQKNRDVKSTSPTSAKNTNADAAESSTKKIAYADAPADLRAAITAYVQKHDPECFKNGTYIGQHNLFYLDTKNGLASSYDSCPNGTGGLLLAQKAGKWTVIERGQASGGFSCATLDAYHASKSLGGDMCIGRSGLVER